MTSPSVTSAPSVTLTLMTVPCIGAATESPDAPEAEALSTPGEADGGPQPDPQPEEPEAQPEPVAQPEPASEQVSEAPARPRRRGWWSFGS